MVQNMKFVKSRRFEWKFNLATVLAGAWRESSGRTSFLIHFSCNENGVRDRTYKYKSKASERVNTTQYKPRRLNESVFPSQGEGGDILYVSMEIALASSSYLVSMQIRQ